MTPETPRHSSSSSKYLLISTNLNRNLKMNPSNSLSMILNLNGNRQPSNRFSRSIMNSPLLSPTSDHQHRLVTSRTNLLGEPLRPREFCPFAQCPY
jgi:hypothetical protein